MGVTVQLSGYKGGDQGQPTTDGDREGVPLGGLARDLCGCLRVARNWDWCETERRGTYSQEWFLCGMGKHQWVTRLGSPSLILDQMLYILEILSRKIKGWDIQCFALKTKQNKIKKKDLEQ